MNYLDDYKKLLNQIITVNHVIISNQYDNPIEYIQGKLIEVNEDHIVIEQYLPFIDYVTKFDPLSTKRKLYYGQFNPMFKFPH